MVYIISKNDNHNNTIYYTGKESDKYFSGAGTKWSMDRKSSKIFDRKITAWLYRLFKHTGGHIIKRKRNTYIYADVDNTTCECHE